MANSTPRLFPVNLKDPLSRKNFIISVSADEIRRLETDNYFASIKLEEAKNLEYAKLISEEDIETVEALDPEINFNESTDGLNDNATGDSAFKWSHEAILLLIKEYRKYQLSFHKGKISQKKLWDEISSQLKAQSHSVTSPQCQSKFSGMKRTYKNIKNHNSKSGNSVKTWPYFTLIDNILGDKLFVTPTTTCSSTGKRVRTSSECSSDSSCSEQDVSSNGLNDNATRDSVFKWSHEAILLLIEEYRKHQPNLHDGTISQKNCWEKISDQLNTKSHCVTGPQCQSKFSGMKRTYKNIKDHNSKSGKYAKTWPYFSLIDELLNDKPFVMTAVPCTSVEKRVRTNSECSRDGSCSEQDVSSKKPKFSPVDKMLKALEGRAKKNEQSRERRFNQLLSFKEQKARKDLQLKTRALDLLEKILNSQNKF